MSTNIKAPIGLRLRVVLGSLKIKFFLVMGYFVSKWLNTYEGYKITRPELHAGAISQAKIDEIVSKLKSLPRDYVDNQVPLSDEEVDIEQPTSPGAWGAKFVRSVIETHRDKIKTVVSIGGAARPSFQLSCIQISRYTLYFC